MVMGERRGRERDEGNGRGRGNGEIWDLMGLDRLCLPIIMVREAGTRLACFGWSRFPGGRKRQGFFISGSETRRSFTLAGFSFYPCELISLTVPEARLCTGHPGWNPRFSLLSFISLAVGESRWFQQLRSFTFCLPFRTSQYAWDEVHIPRRRDASL
jgi:hypothetical protein